MLDDGEKVHGLDLVQIEGRMRKGITKDALELPNFIHITSDKRQHPTTSKP